MTTQMIVRLDPEVKDSLSRLARQEGKTTSRMVREMIEEYIKERDISAYIDGLWDRIGRKARAKGTKPGDIRKAIKAARAGKR